MSASSRFAKFTDAAARRVMRAVRSVESADGSTPGTNPGKLRRTPAQDMFAVRVTIDGGAAGSLMATCSWTYTVKLDGGYSLGMGLSPQKCRLPNVPYETTPNNSWGVGFFDKAGVFVLWDANECPQVENPCPATPAPILAPTVSSDPAWGPGWGGGFAGD